jgi:hypothetical protein
MVAASEVELTEGPRSLNLLPRKMRHSTSSVYLPHSPHTFSPLYNNASKSLLVLYCRGSYVKQINVVEVKRSVLLA